MGHLWLGWRLGRAKRDLASYNTEHWKQAMPTTDNPTTWSDIISGSAVKLLETTFQPRTRKMVRKQSRHWQKTSVCVGACVVNLFVTVHAISVLVCAWSVCLWAPHFTSTSHRLRLVLPSFLASASHYVTLTSDSHHLNLKSSSHFLNLTSASHYFNLTSASHYLNLTSTSRYLNVTSATHDLNLTSAPHYLNFTSASHCSCTNLQHLSHTFQNLYMVLVIHICESFYVLMKHVWKRSGVADVYMNTYEHIRCLLFVVEHVMKAYVWCLVMCYDKRISTDLYLLKTLGAPANSNLWRFLDSGILPNSIKEHPK